MGADKNSLEVQVLLLARILVNPEWVSQEIKKVISRGVTPEVTAVSPL
jgi:hypothetical protein